MWGINWPINKIGLSYTSPANYVELRFLVATVTMFIIAAMSKNVVLPRLRDLPMILVVGIFQMGLLIILSNYGLYLIGAGKAAFLIFTTSIWIIPISLFFGEKMNWLGALSLLLGIAGALLLVGPWHVGKENEWLGDSLLLLSSFSWAIGILCARHMKWHRPPIQLLPWQLLLATLCTTVYAYSRGVSFIPEVLHPILIVTLLYTGSLSLAIGYWVMIVTGRKLTPGVISMGLIWVPVVSLIISSIFLHEKISLLFVISVLLLMAGILLHIYSERKTKKQIQPTEDFP